jgi:hypothetical protein
MTINGDIGYDAVFWVRKFDASVFGIYIYVTEISPTKLGIYPHRAL